MLFSPKDKSKQLKCRLLQVLFGALRVKLSVIKLVNKKSVFMSIASLLKTNFFYLYKYWRPTNLDKSMARAYALAVGAGWVVWTFFLSSIFSRFFLPLSGRRPDID